MQPARKIQSSGAGNSPHAPHAGTAAASEKAGPARARAACDVELYQAAISRRGAQGEGIHPGGRHFSGGAEPAIFRANGRGPVRDLSRSARGEPVALFVLSQARRRFRRRKLAGNVAESAGPLPRGRNQSEDRKLEAKLLADPKERAEHIMLVDLGRNDLGRVCEYGSVKPERLMFVERYSHVMHLVSSLRGRLREGVDCFEALMSCFPAGTLSGAPKIRAMEIIDELEPTRRGIYAGAILYLDFSGNLDSCIALRTLVAKKGRVYIQAGGV